MYDLSFEEMQARLDEVFLGCYVDERSKWDDRYHLEISGLRSRDELEGALKALVVDERRYLIHECDERAGIASISLYTQEVVERESKRDNHGRV